MKNIKIESRIKEMLADVFTPVGIYLRLRDRFRDTILLESADHHAAENSYSFICINAIAGIEITSTRSLEIKYPLQSPEKKAIGNQGDIEGMIWEFMQKFEPAPAEYSFASGLYGYMCFDSVRFFEKFQLQNEKSNGPAIPLMRYRLYQYVIAINHFKDQLLICENLLPGLESELELVESLIRSKDVPVYPFSPEGKEEVNMSDEAFLQMAENGIRHCYRGDVFQIVLSRRFSQAFTGDEFNVYRALRSINPSPYLFFFDFGDYKLMGSSPESQLVIKDGVAVLHPIAGTFKRTGDETIDHQEATRLLADAKENAEHVMLVDLARNDLSTVCDEVQVSKFKQVHYYSHVIHLVSEVKGRMKEKTNPFKLLARTFPAGTLSGAPKHKALELIYHYEPTRRGYYGGAIGFVGFDGSCNHAIMIRTFLSMNNTLSYQAGAGIVAASEPKNELEEVNNKLGALKSAILKAEHLEA